MSELLGIGVSGLLAYQRSLSTTGHNIVNANTAGYSKEEAELVQNSSYQQGGVHIGKGVKVGAIRRHVDDFVQKELRLQTASLHEHQRYCALAERLDTLIAEPDISINQSLDDFFNQWQQLANEPSDIPARQLLLTQADTLSNQFHRLYEQFDEIDRDINANLERETTKINTLTDAIAQINIALVNHQSENTVANDLLDKRDAMIRSLNELVEVHTQQEGAQTHLFLKSGEALVMAGQSYQTTALNLPDAPNRKGLAVALGEHHRLVNQHDIGGSIGGLIKFRDQLLQPAFNALGRMAVVVADKINSQNQLGLDLNSNLGKPLFNNLKDTTALNNQNNRGNATVKVTIDNTSQLSTSDYLLAFDGTQFQVTRINDGKNCGHFLPGSDSLTEEGFSFSTEGVAAIGDSFLVQPVKLAAKNINLEPLAPGEIAAALPIQTRQGSQNTGTAAITDVKVNQVVGNEFDKAAKALNPPLLIQFTRNNRYDIYDNTHPDAPVMLQAGNAFTPGQTNDMIVPSLNYGYQVRIRGYPLAQDTFTIDYNTSATTDNRNALAITQIKSMPVINEKTATLGDAYGQFVAKIGALTQQAQINTQSAKSLVTQTANRLDSISGVNLDEEAAKLLAFEQGYRAASQFIAITAKLMDTLVNLIG